MTTEHQYKFKENELIIFMDNTNTNVVSIGEILLTLRKHIKLILGTTVVVTLVAAIVTIFFWM